MSLSNRQKSDLDNYITGHYGEDQFRNEDDESPDIAEPYDEEEEEYEEELDYEEEEEYEDEDEEEL